MPGSQLPYQVGFCVQPIVSVCSGIECESLYTQGPLWSVGLGGKEHFLFGNASSVTWRAPAWQAEPKVCYYHRNPLNKHRESWEFNLSQQFYFIIFPLFRLFPSRFVPQSCAGPRLRGRSQSAMELDRGAIYRE